MIRVWPHMVRIPYFFMIFFFLGEGKRMRERERKT